MAFSFTLSSFSPSHSSYSNTTMSKSAFLNSMGVKPQQCLPSSTLSISPSLVHLQSPKPKLSLAPPESRTTHSYTSVVKCAGTAVERFTAFVTNTANTGVMNNSFIKDLNHLDSPRNPKTSYISAGFVTNDPNNMVYLDTRFKSKQDMNFFLTTPNYRALEKGSFVSLCSKRTTYQWQSNSAFFPDEGTVVRGSFFELNTKSQSDINTILENLEKLDQTNGSILGHTYGETFADDNRATDGHIASVVVFADKEGMDSFDSDPAVKDILNTIKKYTKDPEVYEYTLP